VRSVLLSNLPNFKPIRRGLLACLPATLLILTDPPFSFLAKGLFFPNGPFSLIDVRSFCCLHSFSFSFLDVRSFFATCVVLFLLFLSVILLMESRLSTLATGGFGVQTSLEAHNRLSCPRSELSRRIQP